ncbi:hypothetical protein [Streptomyces sp. N35]|uniref:hypothetical protein n=1 Tax=Streptomyces sp. N35 TaxID=2795730 RepID=UPI0018F60C79|nr:hypothetical protein [Streptomyces sp. N35]
MAFPQDRLPLKVELAFTEGQWTNVWSDVLDQQVTVARGQADESALAQPATATLTLDNPDGHYTPGHALGAHYPNVRRGVPCRISVQHGSPWLDATAGAPTAAITHDPALNVRGDLDLRVEADVDWYGSGSLLAKWGPAGQYAYRLYLVAGVLFVRWSPDGIATHFTSRPLPENLPGRCAVRVTVRFNPSSATRTVDMYWAASMAGPWQLFHSSQSASAMGVAASTAPLAVPGAAEDAAPAVGRFHRVEIRDGMDGPLAASADFTEQADGTEEFTDSAGRLWSVTEPAQITNWHPRIVGSVDEWAPTWPYGDLSHGDYAGEARCAITVSGVLRRLGQGAKELQSTLRRRIPSGLPVAYWPLEDGQDATAAASPIEGVADMVLTDVQFAAADDLPGSTALPTIGEATSMTVTIGAMTAGEWYFEMVYKLTSLPTAETTILEVVSDGRPYKRFRVTCSTSAVSLYGLRANDPDAATERLLFFTPRDFAVGWTRLRLSAVTEGSTAKVALNWYPIGNPTAYGSTASYTGVPGVLTAIDTRFGAGLSGMPIGHVAVFDTVSYTVYNGADNGFAGETASARIRRLCQEEGVTVRVTGAATATVAMGPQRPATLLDLLAECAAVDGGYLGEQRDQMALEYRPRTTLYNQKPALDLDAGRSEIANPFAPVLDDQRLRNDVTVTRSGGSFARATDTASIVQSGTYDEQVTLNTAADAQLAGQAAWRVYVGTWPGMRYATLASDFAVAPQVIDDWLGVQVGDLARVTNLPPQHPAGVVEVLLDGWSETITPTRWNVSANCRPAGPFRIAGVAPADPGNVRPDGPYRVDTSGSHLAAPLTEQGTTLTVTSPQHPWTTAVLELPFDIEMGGEVMRVHAISGTGPQIFTVTRAVNQVTKPHPAGSAVHLAQPALVAL